MVKHIYTLTDALADGIAKQFPEKFQQKEVGEKDVRGKVLVP